MPAAKERRLDWKPILLEAFFVVLGVVLALTANEWREARNHRQEAAAALESIREELATNRDSVAASLTYHAHLIDTLAAFMRGAAVPGDEGAHPRAELFSRGFIHPAPVLSTAWEAARATDAVRHMAYEDVLLVSQIYQDQERYEEQGQIVSENIYRTLFDEGFQAMERKYRNLFGIIYTFMYSECRLLEQYAAAAPRLGGALAAERPVAVLAACQYAGRR